MAKIIVERFVGDESSSAINEEKTVWQNANNEDMYSGCIRVVEKFTTDDGARLKRKHMHWIRTFADSLDEAEEDLKEAINERIAELKSGKRKLARTYSYEPFYEGQSKDINPKTNEEINRYTRTIAVSPEKWEAIDGKYIDEPAEEQVKNKELNEAL